MSQDTNSKEAYAFKLAQLRYRRRPGAPNRIDDLVDFLDFSNANKEDLIVSITCNAARDAPDLYRGPLYGISGFPGFLYAPQALSPDLQTELAYLAVSEYCEPPHTTNIDLVPPKPGVEEPNHKESMWKLWKDENGFGATPKPIQHDKNGAPVRKYRSFAKLAWSSMGYHHDWTARAYHEEAKSPVPCGLDELATMFARTALLTADCPDKFTSQACIVNYYNVKSIMGGHRDDSELALDKPVVSFSLGLPAVFLLGGKTRDDERILPILVRPGDVMILGGDCRLHYHGAARVLPAAVSIPKVSRELEDQRPAQFTPDSLNSLTNQGTSDENDPCTDSAGDAVVPSLDREALNEYLSCHRLNINVRQVLPDGMDKIPAMQVPKHNA